MRAIGGLIAVALVGHGFAKFLASEHRNGGEWIYLVLTLAIATVVWIVASRAASSERRAAPPPTRSR